MMTDTAPKIYVACLASYNSGILFGKWIDADQDADDILSEISEMLSESSVPNAEEWAIHDHEGFHGLQISESESIDTVSGLGLMSEKYGEAYFAYADLVGVDFATPEKFEECYLGRWDSLQDYAEQLVNDCYDLDQMMGHLAAYFDLDRFARDLELSGDVSTVESADGGVHVFGNC